MKPTFIILTYRRRDLLAECLASLVAAGADSSAETIVGLNGGSSQNEAAEFSARWPWATFVLLSGHGRGEARNILVGKAHGEWLYFLDDDATVPPDFLERISSAVARHPRAPVLGGPNVGPPNAPAFERAVDFLLRSRLGAGPMRRRYAPVGAERSAPGWSFMLSGLAARRELFDEPALRFPSDCVSAEENLFMHRVESARAAGVYCPDLIVTHRRRPTAEGFLRQVFVNGMGRAQITRAAPDTLHWSVLAPSGGLAFVAVLFMTRPLGAGLCVLAYAGACLFESARFFATERNIRAAIGLALLFPLAHAAYVAGFWRGLLSALLISPKQEEAL
jgi:GT2 family glycosyltransferase